MLAIRSLSNRALLPCICLFATVLVLLPIAAKAQCKNWNASGQRYIYQDRQEHVIVITLEQNGRVLAGNASLEVEKRTMQGRVYGSIDKDTFTIEIAWPDKLTGVYKGVILPTGLMNGATYDKSNPKTQGVWRTWEPIKCGGAAPSIPFKITSEITAPTPPPPPIKRSGKMPKAQPAPPEMKAPGIIASQAVFTFPGAFTGFVILTWDGGPDHPYAEVWVKTNNGVETFVVEQGKGARQIPVQRGEWYEYILTDSGTTLATVKVLAY